MHLDRDGVKNDHALKTAHMGKGLKIGKTDLMSLISLTFPKLSINIIFSHSKTTKSSEKH